MKGKISAIITAIAALTALLSSALVYEISFAAPTLSSSEIASAAVQKSPLELIRATVDSIIKVNIELSGAENNERRRGKLREIINPHFYFDEMAKRSLGAQWQERNEDERKEFVQIFSNLLAKTYLGRIDTVKEQIIDYKGEKIDGDKAVVKTMVNHKGDKFPIDYRLLTQNGHWGVYDIVIENVGLVANYRNEFAGIIRKEKFSGLMQRLKKKGAG